MEGTQQFESTLAKANEAIKKAESTASPEQMKEVKSLYLHCSGKIKWMRVTHLPRKEIKGKDGKKLLEEGINDLQEAVVMRKEFMGDQSDHTLNSRALNLIGNCYMELEDPQKAKTFYQEAMDMKKRLVKSEKHWEFPTYYNQFAQVHEKLGRKEEEKWYNRLFGSKKAKKEYQLGVEWMEKSLALQEELGVSDTEHTATFQRNLANIFLGLGQNDKALEYAQKSYENRDARLGKHPETVRIIYLIGIIHEWRKDRRTALESYEKAFEMEESLPEGNHSVVRMLIRNRFEIMCKRLKEKDKLKEFHSKVKEIEKVSSHFSK
jgi:tetratricopeptide (TPR) repeat protein